MDCTGFQFMILRELHVCLLFTNDRELAPVRMPIGNTTVHFVSQSFLVILCLLNIVKQ